MCFGTSTFASGRLHPGKDSEPGIAALRLAVSAGVRLVHSNPKLGTQWAVRRALGSMTGVKIRHAVKVEAPVDADLAVVRARVAQAIDDSCLNLRVGQLHAVVMEIDLKRTQDQAKLVDSPSVETFYNATAREVLQSGRVDQVIAYCHSPAQMAAAVRAKGVSGVAAQYNIAEPWPALFLDDIEARGLRFVGMSPLRRGMLACTSDPARSRIALRWAAADPRVATIVTTMSSLHHVSQVIDALMEPLPLRSVQQLTAAWLEAASPRLSPEGIRWSPLDRLKPFYSPTQEGPS